MTRKKPLLVIVISIIMFILASCNTEPSSAYFSVTYLGPDGEIVATHVLKEGEMDIPPLEGDLPQNEEFYWSLTEDGELYEFNTPITENITLYLSKSKNVNVDFYYRDGVKITSKLCKTGSKISASDLGFNSDIFTVQLFDKTSGEEFKSSRPFAIYSGLKYR